MILFFNVYFQEINIQILWMYNENIKGYNFK